MWLYHMLFLLQCVASELDCSQHMISPIRFSTNKGSPPPRDIPAHLLSHYTRCGQIPTEFMYVDDTNKGLGLHYNYSRSVVDGMIATAHKWQAAIGRIPRAPDQWLFQALQRYSIKGLDILIIGSIEPWAESVALSHGALSVTTVDYNRLSYQHPQISTLLPEQLFDGTEDNPDLTVNNSKKQFGAIISLSSLDHDGLGRYGDPLCPDGDLLSMRDLRTLLTPSGLLFLSVPIGPDALVWNLHRRYGPIRLPLLLYGYQQLDCFGWDQALLTAPRSFRKSYEPVFVLQAMPDEKLFKSDL